MSEDNKIEKSHGKWHGGKGSARKDNNNSKYAENWEKIFGKKIIIIILKSPKIWINKLNV